MPGFPKLSQVEGTFEELSQEVATYLDTLKGEGSTVAADIAPLLAEPADPENPTENKKETNKDEVLKKLVTAASVLNSAPERELQAAYNLLIYLVNQAEEPEKFMPRLCTYLSSPITSSGHNGTGLALGILSSLFNTIPPDDDSRFHVLLAITDVVRNSKNFHSLQPQLKSLDDWAKAWDLEPEEERKLYLAVYEAANAGGEAEESYIYLLKALSTLQSDASSQQARELSLKALKTALQNEKHFDFTDLTSLDSIQALRKSDETWSELLDLFVDQKFEDLQDFKEANDDFLSENGLDEDVLDRKMRLLTLATLSASHAETRTVPYSLISKALQIPPSETEMWVIDCIRKGLVEGKLSQQRQEFLIHRCTYRTFGDKQWREVASRLETWKASLKNVLVVIRQQKEEFVREKEAELAGPDTRSGQGYRPSGRRNQNQPVQQSALSID